MSTLRRLQVGRFPWSNSRPTREVSPFFTESSAFFVQIAYRVIQWLCQKPRSIHCGRHLLHSHGRLCLTLNKMFAISYWKPSQPGQHWRAGKRSAMRYIYNWSWNIQKASSLRCRRRKRFATYTCCTAS